jgi:hypothetical protein
MNTIKMSPKMISEKKRIDFVQILQKIHVLKKSWSSAIFVVRVSHKNAHSAHSLFALFDNRFYKKPNKTKNIVAINQFHRVILHFL